MKNILFLDIDGPMIPWWGIDCKDETGRNGRILEGFPFFSLMHPDAITFLRIIAFETNSAIVTNSTHNGGGRSKNNKYHGPAHIIRLFKANGIDDLLLKFDDLDIAPPPTAIAETFFATAFKNPTYMDITADRTVGIRTWFARWGKYMTKRPAFLAIDDEDEHFREWNEAVAPEDRIPLLHVGTHLNADLAAIAIKRIKADPNYIAKK